jgi:hypothetical protein
VLACGNSRRDLRAVFEVLAGLQDLAAARELNEAAPPLRRFPGGDLDQRLVLRAEDLDVFANLLWHDLSSRAKVATEVLKRTNPLRQQALEFSDMAASVVAAVTSATDRGEAALEARKKLGGLKKAINATIAKAQADGRDTAKLATVLADVEAKGKEIGKALLELAVE